MYMGMEREILSPWMDPLDDARLSTQIPFVTRQGQKCLRSCLMKKGVEKLLIGTEQGVEIMWHSENNVKVFRVEDFRAALVDPEFLQDRLTVRTMAVAT